MEISKNEYQRNNQPLKEMVKIVKDDVSKASSKSLIQEERNKSNPVEMVKIIDNSLPYNKNSVEMCRIVEKPAPKTTGLVEMCKIIDKDTETSKKSAVSTALVPTVAPLLDGEKDIIILGEENSFVYQNYVL